MSLVSRCHLTLASSFSVCASNTTVAPISAVWHFGFLVKADTEEDKDDEGERHTKVYFCSRIIANGTCLKLFKITFFIKRQMTDII